MDVLDSTAPPTRPRLSALAGAGVLLVLVVVVPDARQDGLDLLGPASDRRAPGTLSLVLDPGPAVVGRSEDRPWDGQLVLHLDDAVAVLQVSAAARAEAVGPGFDHSWGPLRARIGDRHCTGTFGWRGSSGDPYGGGRVELGCDDGTQPSGQLRTDEGPPVEDAAWTGILDLAPS